jgi:hypothetical protein
VRRRPLWDDERVAQRPATEHGWNIRALSPPLTHIVGSGKSGFAIVFRDPHNRVWSLIVQHGAAV